MFIKSFKTSKVEIIIMIMGLIMFAATLIYIIMPKSSPQRTSANTVTSVVDFLVNAQDAKGREDFLSQFGWEIDSEPIDAREIIIPAEFDEEYTAYNEMQKKLGFDLSEYRGVSVKKWVYKVNNYPEITNNVTATLLINKGKVIGGDISSTGDKKFTHSFLMSAENVPQSTSSEQTAEVSSAE